MFARLKISLYLCNVFKRKHISKFIAMVTTYTTNVVFSTNRKDYFCNVASKLERKK